MHAVRQEIVILSLFAVGNDWRDCGFKPFDGVSNGVFKVRIKGGILTIELGESLEEVKRPRETANGLGGYGVLGWLNVGHGCASVSLFTAVTRRRDITRRSGLSWRAVAA